MTGLSAHELRSLSKREQAMIDDEVRDAALLAAQQLVAALMSCCDASAASKEAAVWVFWFAAHERRSPPDVEQSVKQKVERKGR